ncbi:MAG: hypothetical protein CL610_19450 [Anaerolineaceae bacterium]|nr:hypothetical protein [Anaerolineaceae bacterium]
MQETSEETYSPNEPLSLGAELRSIAISSVGIVFNTSAFLQDEMELASWRRVFLSILFGSTLSFLISFLGYLIFEIWMRLRIGYMFNVRWLDLAVGFGIRIPVVIIRQLAGAYLSYRWVAKHEPEAEYVAHTQSLVMALLPQTFVLSLLVTIVELLATMSDNPAVFWINADSIALYTVIIGGLEVVVIVYFYWLLSRVFFLLYPAATRKVRWVGLAITIFAYLLIGLLTQLPVIINVIYNLFPQPPGF